MPALKTYDLFISHSWDYNDEYYRLVDLLTSASHFKWRNYSVPEHDQLDGGSNRKLEAELERQVRPVNAVLVLGGMYVNHRTWIQTEIEFAQYYKKPIIGIRPWGSERMPTIVEQAARVVVGWNTDSIVQAIRTHAL